MAGAAPPKAWPFLERQKSQQKNAASRLARGDLIDRTVVIDKHWSLWQGAADCRSMHRSSDLSARPRMPWSGASRLAGSSPAGRASGRTRSRRTFADRRRATSGPPWGSLRDRCLVIPCSASAGWKAAGRERRAASERSCPLFCCLTRGVQSSSPPEKLCRKPRKHRKPPANFAYRLHRRLQCMHHLPRCLAMTSFFPSTMPPAARSEPESLAIAWPDEPAALAGWLATQTRSQAPGTPAACGSPPRSAPCRDGPGASRT
jgi:hypothetical protein